MERIGEDDSEEEDLFRDLWDDETQREVMLWRSSRLTARLGWEDPQVFEIRICSLLCVSVQRSRDVPRLPSGQSSAVSADRADVAAGQGRPCVPGGR